MGSIASNMFEYLEKLERAAGADIFAPEDRPDSARLLYEQWAALRARQAALMIPAPPAAGWNHPNCNHRGPARGPMREDCRATPRTHADALAMLEWAAIDSDGHIQQPFCIQTRKAVADYLKDRLIDLRAFRAGLMRNWINAQQIVMGDQKNADETQFKWFDIRSFPAVPPLVVAASTNT
tara:strand:- start:586 stop:1125 length:540 start_codon:yes stop_codon:yes gene_type:complete